MQQVQSSIFGIKYPDLFTFLVKAWEGAPCFKPSVKIVFHWADS